MVFEDATKTSGYRFLKLEQKFIEKFEISSLKIFNNLAFEISNSINNLNPFEKKDIKDSTFFILKYILRELDKKGYKYRESNLFFYERILSKKVSCRDFAILYQSVIELIQTDMIVSNLIIAPKHAFIRIRYITGETQNWEVTGNRFSPKKLLFFENNFYISKFNIFKSSIDNNVYLHPLNQKETIGFFHHCIGTSLFNIKKYSEAIQQFDFAIKKFPNLAESHFYRGYCMYNLGILTEETANFLQTALKLSPGLSNANSLLSSVIIKLKFNPCD